MTNWTTINTFEDLLSSANSVSPFWTMILFMMWVVLVITFLPFGTSVAFVGGSFIAFLIGMFLGYMGLVAWKWIMGLLGIAIAVIIWDILFGKKEVS